MGFQLNKIDEFMNKEVDRTTFLKELGTLCLGLTLLPSLLNKLVDFDRFKMIGDNMYIDDELVIERREE
jgi:hypothetical protein